MRWLSCVALLFSLLALGISANTWHAADARAEEALRRREKSLVIKHRPAVVKLCQDFGIQEPPENIQTLDELCAPLGRLFEGLNK